MKYISVVQAAEKWGVSERSVRNYCAEGKIKGAFIKGKTWSIPEDAAKPSRKNACREVRNTLLEILQQEKAMQYFGGIYHKIQIAIAILS